MNEEMIDKCTAFLKDNNISPFKVSEWQDIIEKENIDPEAYDILILYFAMNLNENIVHYSYKDEYPQFLFEVKEAIYKKLTDQNFRGKTELFTQFGSVFIAENLSNIIFEDSSILPAFISFIIIEISKIGIDAWCKYYEKTKVREKDEG